MTEMRTIWKNGRLTRVSISKEEVEIYRTTTHIWVCGLQTDDDLELFYNLCAERGLLDRPIGNTEPTFFNAGMTFFFVKNEHIPIMRAACEYYNDNILDRTSIDCPWGVQ